MDIAISAHIEYYKTFCTVMNRGKRQNKRIAKTSAVQ
jgi:hypothetical protein